MRLALFCLLFMLKSCFQLARVWQQVNYIMLRSWWKDTFKWLRHISFIFRLIVCSPRQIGNLLNCITAGGLNNRMSRWGNALKSNMKFVISQKRDCLPGTKKKRRQGEMGRQTRGAVAGANHDRRREMQRERKRTNCRFQEISFRTKFVSFYASYVFNWWLLVLPVDLTYKWVVIHRMYLYAIYTRSK